MRYARNLFSRQGFAILTNPMLARLAVHRDHQGQGQGQGLGLGRALFQDAAMRVVHADDAIGFFGLQALTEEAKRFYERLGLQQSPLDPLVLMPTVVNLKAALANP